MAKKVAKSWTSVIQYPTQDPMHPSSEPNQRHVDDTLIGLLHDLHPYLQHVVLTMEGELNLVQNDHNQRLKRGINESGLMIRDYGKKFTGYYFDLLRIMVKTQPGTKKKTIVFLESYLEGLIIAYFAQHPSIASNWENSFRNSNSPKIATDFSPSSITNFPQIEIQFSF